MTQGDRGEALALAAAQGLLAVLTIEIFRVTLPPARSRWGVYVLPVLALHVALYYGVFNVIPALLIEWRPQYIVVNRVPEAPISAYLAATWAALSLLVGVTLGCRLANGFLHKRPKALPTPCRDGRFPWLPEYRTSLAIALGLSGMVLFCTVRYGIQYYLMFSDEDQLAALPFWEQLLFHGIFPFLPLPAFLAAAAMVAARTRRQHRWGVVALIVLAAFNIAALSVWGMRSTAILAFLLPMALLVYTGRVRWHKMLLPAVVVATLVYAVVTVARVSNLGEQLGQGTSFTLGTASEVLEAGADKTVLLERLTSDLSYRTSGLEAVAGIIHGQNAGVLRPMGGRVVLAGFIQALPAALRPVPELPNRIKTAPSNAGWFVPGDYVTTLLSELVMDVGPWLVVLPAVAVGLIFALFDRTLLMLGQRPALQPLLVVRMGWLLTVLSTDGLANSTLMFVKGTIGYSVFLVVFGVAGSVAHKLARVKAIS